MFSSEAPGRTAFASLRESARRAASLARAFILLEDSSPHARAGGAELHPHRQPLRAPLRPRRPGAGWPRPQLCTTPLAPRAERLRKGKLATPPSRAPR